MNYGNDFRFAKETNNNALHYGNTGSGVFKRGVQN